MATPYCATSNRCLNLHSQFRNLDSDTNEFYLKLSIYIYSDLSQIEHYRTLQFFWFQISDHQNTEMISDKQHWLFVDNLLQKCLAFLLKLMLCLYVLNAQCKCFSLSQSHFIQSQLVLLGRQINEELNPNSDTPHVEVPLGKTPKPKLLPMEPATPCTGLGVCVNHFCHWGK